eukprot:14616-Heterococcus_DN1.PRE.16
MSANRCYRTCIYRCTKYSEVYLNSRAIHNAQTHDTWTYPKVLAQDMIVAVLEVHKEADT